MTGKLTGKIVVLGNVYVYWGGEELLNKLRSELGTEDVYAFQIMGVEEARLVRERLNIIQDSKNSWMIVSAKGITDKGQNALLKSLEELSSSRGVVFILPRSSKLIDTFLSRVIVVGSDNSKLHYLSQFGAKFMAMSIADRLNVIRADDNPNPDLLDALEELVHVTEPAVSRSILSTKYLLRESALSAKMALEHVAYLIPANPNSSAVLK